jgi:hypothetical protein
MNLTDSIEIAVGTWKRGGQVVSKEAVPAKLYGPLAVHRDVMQGKRRLWRVTHVASGLMVSGEMTLKAAVSMAKGLQHLPEWQDVRLADGWSTATKDVFDTLSRAVLEVRQQAAA